MNCAKHRSENRWAAQAPASPDLEVEAVHESVSELALPVDVRPGGDTAESNRRDDLTPRDLLTHARVHGARVVVAGLQVAGVLHADAEPADGDPPVRRHDAVVRGADARAIRSGKVDAGVPRPEVLRDDSGDRPREAAGTGRLRAEARSPEHRDRHALRLLKRRERGPSHEDLLSRRATLGLEVAAVEGEDDGRIHLELARDRVDGVAVLHRVKRTLSG